MDRPESQDQSWEQLQLLNTDLIELHYRIGVYRTQDHCQFELEVIDPATGSVIALSSRPHVSLDRAMSIHSLFAKDLYNRLSDLTGPF